MNSRLSVVEAWGKPERTHANWSLQRAPSRGITGTNPPYIRYWNARQVEVVRNRYPFWVCIRGLLAYRITSQSQLFYTNSILEFDSGRLDGQDKNKEKR